MEYVAYLVALEFLRGRSLATEKALAALDWLAVALANVNNDHLADRFNHDVNRRIAVTGNVLYAGAEDVRIRDAHNRAVVTHPEQDPAAECIGEGHQLAGKRG